MSLPPPPVAVRTPNPLVRALRAPFELRTWKETIHLLLNMPIGIATFTIVVTGFALGFGLLITLVGIPILIAMLYVSRAMGWFERGRAKLLLDLDVPRPYRPDPTRDRWWRVPVSRLTDPATWTEIVYHLLLLPIGVLTFTVAFTFWVLGASLLFLPVYAWALPEPVHAFDSWVKVTLDAPPNLDLVGGGRRLGDRHADRVRGAGPDRRRRPPAHRGSSAGLRRRTATSCEACSAATCSRACRR